MMKARLSGRGKMVVVRCAAGLLRQADCVAAAAQLSRAAVVLEALSQYCEFWEEEGAALQQAESEGMLKAAREVLQEMQGKR